MTEIISSQRKRHKAAYFDNSYKCIIFSKIYRKVTNKKQLK